MTVIPQRIRCTDSNGYVTAVAAGQRQRFHSGVGIFNWYYPSSPPRVVRFPGVDLERAGLVFRARPYIKGGVRLLFKRKFSF